ncbi:hypothetical protein QOZ80_5AG0367880 [Eleusine coracana subsp. coracana]|nr:hypothetical protein QOZ80_5AG0367880 [Eleusine coracana subsp. coracana]
MTKFVAIAAVCLAAILAVAVGQQGETEQQQNLRDMRCVREVKENPLDACRQVLHRQLTGSRTGNGSFQWDTGLRLQCCQQLQDVSRECRCAAIRSMVRGYELTMPPLEGGSGGGESRGQEHCGEGAQCGKQQGGSSGCGKMGWWRRQQGNGQQGGQGCGCGCGQGKGQQPATRVKLHKVRQYSARLPTMCSIEPQECNVFAGTGRE